MKMFEQLEKQNRSVSRFAIYVYYETDNLLYDYAKFYLSKLKAICSKVIVVSNCKLDSVAQGWLTTRGFKLVQRGNTGYDFAAWKDALSRMDLKQLEEYDELILCNNSVFGPLFSFDELFAKMETRKCDFWGVSLHPAIGVIQKTHLQSYFLVFKKKVFCSDAFRNYWKNLSLPSTFQQAIEEEIKFTPYLEDSGFTWSALLDNRLDIKNYIDIPRNNPLLSLQNGSPFIKKKVFLAPYSYYFDRGLVKDASSSLDWVAKNTNYPVNLIEEYLIKKLYPSQYKSIFHKNYVIDENANSCLNEDVVKRTAIIFYAYFDDLCEKCVPFILNMPEKSQVFIVSSSKKTLDKYKDLLSQSPERKIEFKLQENRGRNEAAYFLTCRGVWDKFSYICLAHDKKLRHLPKVEGDSAFIHSFQNVLATKGFVLQLLELFENNERIGMVVPPTPIHSEWQGILRVPYGPNKGICLDLLKKMECEESLDPCPIAPYGGNFWVRSSALLPLLRIIDKEGISFFPKEPLALDGTVLHALERIYPEINRKEGFFTAVASPNSYVSAYFDNLHYLARLYSNQCLNLSEELAKIPSTRSFVVQKLKQKLEPYPLIYKIAKNLKLLLTAKRSI